MESRIFQRYRDIIDDWEAFADALRRPLPPVVWANTLCMTPDQLRQQLAQDGYEARPVAWYPARTSIRIRSKTRSTGPLNVK